MKATRGVFRYRFDFRQDSVEGVEDPKQAMIDFGHSTAERFSGCAELEFETGMSVFFSHGAKKRYVGQVVWPKEVMMVKGYETQRTDSFRYLTDGMKEIFKHVLPMIQKPPSISQSKPSQQPRTAKSQSEN